MKTGNYRCNKCTEYFNELEYTKGEEVLPLTPCCGSEDYYNVEHEKERQDTEREWKDQQGVG